ncbi:hypothetical protein CEXT_587321 [Caerostris extrusa]|uniref:Uncharacterized protein n=1 Tax=Caerostris extrusa TaxID=172846 RepID=A0AAV4RRI6_CAEEX|nr:hypothetical protein CEXT_587321 [Caerostris extrusa]
MEMYAQMISRCRCNCKSIQRQNETGDGYVLPELECFVMDIGNDVIWETTLIKLCRAGSSDDVSSIIKSKVKSDALAHPGTPSTKITRTLDDFREARDRSFFLRTVLHPSTRSRLPPPSTQWDRPINTAETYSGLSHSTHSRVLSVGTVPRPSEFSYSPKNTKLCKSIKLHAVNMSPDYTELERAFQKATCGILLKNVRFIFQGEIYRYLSLAQTLYANLSRLPRARIITINVSGIGFETRF